MKDKNENKQGYKKTKIGWIPKDWNVKEIREVAEVDKKNLPEQTDPDYTFNYISLSEVSEGVISLKRHSTVSFRNAPSRARRIVKKGDILLSTVRPYLYGFAIIKENNDDLIASTGFAVLTTSSCDTNYLYQQLFGYQISKQFYQLLVGSNYPAINSNDVRKLKIPFPKINEQKDIGFCLSTWDRAIHTLTQLIRQKQERKKWLMQVLLTGKKRLPAFAKASAGKPGVDSEFRKTGAGNIFENVSMKNHPNEELLSVTQNQGVIPRNMLETKVTMPTGERSSFKLVKSGNFVISLRSFQGGLEYSEYRGIVSPAYTVLRPIKKIDERFYKYYFKSHDFVGHLAIAVIGIRDGKQISYSDFCTVKIPDISVEEQTAIANVLQTADKEIEILNQKLELLKAQKKGLMQQLLTGRKRLVNPKNESNE